MTRVFSKPSLNLDQQIAQLRDNGMAIPDEERARYWLTHVSYYRLSAYWLHFERSKDEPGPRFKPGTDFDTVTALYDFDRVLRRLVMRGTEHVEVALRGSWAYQLATLDHGHSYLDAGLYYERKQFHDNLAKLAKDVGESNETYIDHYRKTYRDPALPPVWMVAEMMSFGQLSRWYSSLADRSLRNRIAVPLGLTETDGSGAFRPTPCRRSEHLCSPWPALEPGFFDLPAATQQTKGSAAFAGPLGR